MEVNITAPTSKTLMFSRHGHTDGGLESVDIGKINIIHYKVKGDETSRAVSSNGLELVLQIPSFHEYVSKND